jgi:hypothetical protein
MEARGARSTSSTDGGRRSAPAPAAPAAPPPRRRGGHPLPTAKYFRSLGWTVDLAREAEEGEALISHRHYDLAILDVRVTRFGARAAWSSCARSAAATTARA